jgi:hypothetical protein
MLAPPVVDRLAMTAVTPMMMTVVVAVALPHQWWGKLESRDRMVPFKFPDPLVNVLPRTYQVYSERQEGEAGDK